MPFPAFVWICFNKDYKKIPNDSLLLNYLYFFSLGLSESNFFNYKRFGNFSQNSFNNFSFLQGLLRILTLVIQTLKKKT